jgi:hypothetical protein
MVTADFNDGCGIEDRLGTNEVVAERVEVSTCVGVFRARDRFRRHVVWRAHEDIDVRKSRRGVLMRNILHKSEVDHLGDIGFAATVTQDDVRRLDVTMDQSNAVRLRQRAADLLEHVERAFDRHRPLLRDQTFEIDPVEKLHRIVEEAVRRATIVVEGAWRSAAYKDYAKEVSLIEVPDDYNPLTQLQKNVKRNQGKEQEKKVPILD